MQSANCQPEFVDIHAHVLPGLDDGPGTLDEALLMCERYVAEGVAVLVATPHMGDPRYGATPDAIRRAAEALSGECAARGLPLRVLPGADVRLCPELLQALDAGQLVTLGDVGTHLLLEMPHQTAPPIEGLLRQFAARGIVPVLSHPERNAEVVRKRERLHGLVQQGCVIQVTGASLLGVFGRRVRKATEALLQEGLVHVVAGDAHAATGGRRPIARRVAERLQRLMGSDAVRALMRDNPARMIGRPAPQPSAVMEAALGSAAR